MKSNAQFFHRLKFLFVIIAVYGFTSSITAQDYDLSWSTIDGGGGTSSGGDFVLSGTIGQPDARKMTGGDYLLDGGFWIGSGCIVDLNDLHVFTSQWLQSGPVEANFDWAGNPVPGNIVDLVDYNYLAAYWLSYCPGDWPW